MSGRLEPDAFAALLADYCLEVRPGQTVLVRSTTAAEPLLLALHRAILEREAWPLLRVELPGQERAFFLHARDRQLDAPSPAALAEIEAIDATVGIQAPHAPNELGDVDPSLIARAARGRRELREVMLSKRWCSTLWPTPAVAQRAGMPLAELEAFVRRALLLDHPQGAQAGWRELSAFQDELVARLSRARELRIEADGTDLVLRVEGRRWVNSDGRRNMPSGEVFTSPIETSANGRIRFTVPTGPQGVEVAGVELELRDGEVVAASAERGEEYLRGVLDTDPGARRLGEIGIGTNRGIDRPIGAILFDEKIGGTVHLALGRSYPETGGTNESAVHWDLICDLRRGGRLLADGVVIQENGEFV